MYRAENINLSGRIWSYKEQKEIPFSQRFCLLCSTSVTHVKYVIAISGNDVGILHIQFFSKQYFVPSFSVNQNTLFYEEKL